MKIGDKFIAEKFEATYWYEEMEKYINTKCTIIDASLTIVHFEDGEYWRWNKKALKPI